MFVLLNGILKGLSGICLGKKDVNMLRVVQSVRNEIGCSSRQQKIFRVRRSKVLEALHWLKKFNSLCRHIEIVSDALNWLSDNEEASLVTGLIENPKLQVASD
jgi:hypothetical protein